MHVYVYMYMCRVYIPQGQDIGLVTIENIYGVQQPQSESRIGKLEE